MISVTEAKKLLFEHLEKGKLEQLQLGDALGTFLAEDIFSPIDVPSFDNSAMDGYAMKFDGSDSEWEIEKVVQAGDTEKVKISPGKTARIFTGAKIPEGTDTVIPQELVERISDDRIGYTGDKIRRGSNVRYRGSQCKSGDSVMEKGQKIGAGQIGLLASLGIAEIKTYFPPKVGFIVTGNELKEVGQQLLEGEIYNSNGPMLEALLKESGIREISEFRARDEKKSLQQQIDLGLEENDVLILSGGISVGDYDFVKECLEKAGVEQLFYKLKQRPGKPFFAGKKGKQWIFALPGNPASVHSCFIQYVRPCLQFMMGSETPFQPDHVLPLDEDFNKKSGFTFFLKATKKNGKIKLLQGQQSFNLQAFATANCLVELPEALENVPAGTPVKVYDL